MGRELNSQRAPRAHHMIAHEVPAVDVPFEEWIIQHLQCCVFGQYLRCNTPGLCSCLTHWSCDQQNRNVVFVKLTTSAGSKRNASTSADRDAPLCCNWFYHVNAAEPNILPQDRWYVKLWFNKVHRRSHQYLWSWPWSSCDGHTLEELRGWWS